MISEMVSPCRTQPKMSSSLRSMPSARKSTSYAISRGMHNTPSMSPKMMSPGRIVTLPTLIGT